jgi:CCR4-NOT transcription complex subunit 2
LTQVQGAVGPPGTVGSQSLRAGLPGGGSSLDQLVHLYQQHQQSQFSRQLGTHPQQLAAVGQSSREMGVKSLQGVQGAPDRFGLLGLLSVIRMSDPDLTTLALGTDLTTLGLNLNSRENLYKTFASPWADGPVRGEPEFTLPQCYVQQAPRLQVKAHNSSKASRV